MDSFTDPHKKKLEDPLTYLRISTILSFAPGQTIYSAGDPAADIFLIISGHVKVTRGGHGEREITINIYQPDEFFGESALIESRRSGSASALGNTKVMAWPVSQIEKIGLEHPKLLYALLQMMTERLGQFEDRIDSFIAEDARHRLARALIGFCRDPAEDSLAEPARMMPLTHEVLSSYIGASREVVTQFMNRFRQLGYLSYNRKETLVSLGRMRQVLREENTSPGHSPRPALEHVTSATQSLSAGGAAL